MMSSVWMISPTPSEPDSSVLDVLGNLCRAVTECTKFFRWTVSIESKIKIIFLIFFFLSRLETCTPGLYEMTKRSVVWNVLFFIQNLEWGYFVRIFIIYDWVKCMLSLLIFKKSHFRVVKQPTNGSCSNSFYFSFIHGNRKLAMSYHPIVLFTYTNDSSVNSKHLSFWYVFSIAPPCQVSSAYNSTISKVTNWLWRVKRW